MIPEQEQILKHRFLDDNPNAGFGINAAVQHNKLYAPGTNNSRRTEIRQYWRDQLIDLGRKYSIQETRDVFLSDILELQNRMNEEFSDSFADTGFKISHAQKSLSIYLKNRWCHNTIPAPPLCPIDRQVLCVLGRPWYNIPWTAKNYDDYVVSWEEIERRATGVELSVAQWELLLFSGN